MIDVKCRYFISMSIFLYYIIQKFLFRCNFSGKITRMKCYTVGSRIQDVFACKESQQPNPQSKLENAPPRALGSGRLIWYILLESKISKQVAFWTVSQMGTSSCNWDQQLQSIPPAIELLSPGLLQDAKEKHNHSFKIPNVWTLASKCIEKSRS